MMRQKSQDQIPTSFFVYWMDDFFQNEPESKMLSVGSLYISALKLSYVSS